jgi:hypothetical protein
MLRHVDVDNTHVDTLHRRQIADRDLVKASFVKTRFDRQNDPLHTCTVIEAVAYAIEGTCLTSYMAAAVRNGSSTAGQSTS